ncbi:MAG TPA: nucleotidyl transferase AbiEii/AbiGii toxin family protein [Bacteroidales bacterium]|nr:nucleotidyl transferase AbiEii/AbiGii toxin family protein [Bacteroidales bacterium]
MLYYSAIDAATLELLIKIQKLPLFKNLCLAGGTSLALQIGHRKSIDLDFFGKLKSDEIEINKQLKQLGSIQLIHKTENIFIYLINNIKIDIVNYHYEWLEKPILTEGIKLAGKKDIAAMKLSAITGRGTKKDFFDLYFLLQKYSMTEMFNFYKQKYDDGSEFLVIKSLSYFDDAEKQMDPEMLKKINWQKVKNNIKKEVEKYIKEKNS